MQYGLKSFVRLVEGLILTIVDAATGESPLAIRIIVHLKALATKSRAIGCDDLFLPYWRSTICKADLLKNLSSEAHGCSTSQCR